MDAVKASWCRITDINELWTRLGKSVPPIARKEKLYWPAEQLPKFFLGFVCEYDSAAKANKSRLGRTTNLRIRFWGF